AVALVSRHLSRDVVAFPRCPTRRSSDLGRGALHTEIRILRRVRADPAGALGDGPLRLQGRVLPDGRLPFESTAKRAHPDRRRRTDRKSTRLNSSHVKISYAVFCLKKKRA